MSQYLSFAIILFTYILFRIEFLNRFYKCVIGCDMNSASWSNWGFFLFIGWLMKNLVCPILRLVNWNDNFYFSWYFDGNGHLSINPVAIKFIVSNVARLLFLYTLITFLFINLWESCHTFVAIISSKKRRINIVKSLCLAFYIYIYHIL